MTSLKNLQAVVQTVHVSANKNLTDLDAIHASIYNLVIHAFLSEVLTLARMNNVIHAVREGVNDFAITKTHLTSDMLPMAQRSAYRGLYSAMCEGLAALGLAHAEFMKNSRFSVSASFNEALGHETLQLKHQLDHIAILSDRQTDIDVKNMQKQLLQQLSTPIETNWAQDDKSILPWADQFFQICEFRAIKNSENLTAQFMLLGLFTSGVLAGTRSYESALRRGVLQV